MDSQSSGSGDAITWAPGWDTASAKALGLPPQTTETKEQSQWNYRRWCITSPTNFDRYKPMLL